MICLTDQSGITIIAVPSSQSILLLTVFTTSSVPPEHHWKVQELPGLVLWCECHLPSSDLALHIVLKSECPLDSLRSTCGEEMVHPVSAQPSWDSF